MHNDITIKFALITYIITYTMSYIKFNIILILLYIMSKKYY